MTSYWKSGVELLMQKMSVRDIAQKVGLAESSIYDIKNGYSKEPRGIAAVRLYELIATAKAGAGDTAQEPLKEAA